MCVNDKGDKGDFGMAFLMKHGSVQKTFKQFQSLIIKQPLAVTPTEEQSCRTHAGTLYQSCSFKRML